MLLVTTADERTWDNQDKILFLGEWCRLAHRREAWSSLNARVLPYHWDDRAKMHRDAALLADRYEALLLRLAEALNAIHGTHHAVAYWRLVAGPWLQLMMTVVWDRSEGVRRAIDEGATRTRLFDTLSLPPASFDAMAGAAHASDLWNHMLIGMVLRHLPGLAIESAGTGPGFPGAPVSSAGGKGWIRDLLRAVARFRSHSVLLCNMYAKPGVLMNLELALGQIPVIVGAPLPPEFPADPAWRAQLSLDCGDDVFGRALGDIIPEAFPATLLEGYEQLRRDGSRSFPRVARAIVTANAQHNETFCIWAGAQREKGVKLAIAQHGAHYGTDLIEAQEDHEVAVSDSYISWGWDRRDAPHIVPLPALKFAGRPKVSGTASGGLLAAYDSGHRYPNRLYGVPIAGQRIEDNALQLALLRALPDQIQAALKIRCHPLDDGYGFRQHLRDAGFGDRFDTSASMWSALERARLCLVGSQSTSLLESLYSGVPTVALYDLRFAEERPAAQPYFEALRRAGILHHDPQSAAAQIAAIWADPGAWWARQPVADARDRFVGRFARRDPAWRSQWRRAIDGLVAGNRAN